MNDIYYKLKYNSEKINFDTINSVLNSLCPLPICKIDDCTINILAGSQPLDESLFDKIGNALLTFDEKLKLEIFEYLGNNKVHNFYKKFK